MTGRRLTLVVPSLSQGGAERVVAKMADHWAGRGEAVTVITLSDAAEDTYPLDPRVARNPLGLLHHSRGALQAISNNIARIGRLRGAIRDSAPDLVISFTDRMNVVTLWACRPLRVDVIIAERSNPARNETSRVWRWLGRRSFPSAKALVVQTERAARQMSQTMRGRPIHVIPNFVERPSVDPGVPPRTGDGRWIVGVGRLSPEKGFDLLIDAFSRVADRHPQWSLKIIGEGAARAELQRRIEARGVAGRAVLAGWSPKPANTLKRCDLFVLPSRYEGFPNALLEAMACGLPAISFDCDSGPSEIIQDGVNGLLVPPENAQSMADAIDRAIRDEALRNRLATEAVHVVERFSVERFFASWENVLQSREQNLQKSRRAM